jgi:hypothetical protein
MIEGDGISCGIERAELIPFVFWGEKDDANRMAEGRVHH